MAPHAPQATAPVRRQPGGPAKGDRRRQAIVDAVETLLGERTIAELSVESIAACAGISRSGFYFYFESKYAALGDALGDVGDEMARASEDFFAGSDDPPEEYVPRSLQGVGDLWRRHAALMVAVVDAAHSDAGARALWEAWKERWIVAITERIATERAAGRAPDAGPGARDLARAVLTMNLAMFDDDARRGASDAEARRTIDALTHVWLRAIWGAGRQA